MSVAEPTSMAVITLSGEPGCRTREVGRLVAQRLGFELITAPRLDEMITEEFGADPPLPHKAWLQVVASVLLRLATESHLVVGVDGSEMLFRNIPLLRVRIVAPESRRIGNTMLDDRLDRPAARARIREQEKALRALRKARFSRATPDSYCFDLVCNAENMEAAALTSIIEAAARERQLTEQGLISRTAEAQLQFQLRLQLAKVGIQPRGQARIKKALFVHPSEEIFANLLDFYRIPWEYEPRSFPVMWDKDGNVLESFTPDFYLPESDLYVELTTMKQSLVTKKNRKIKLLRQIYPGVNIQVFYQKDMHDLVLKYGLSAEAVQA
jgi:cytidylate kinase